MHQVGYPANAFYVYEQVYDKEGNPIEGEYVDRNGNGTIDANDRYFYHKPSADITLGLNTSLKYKNWTLAASAHGSMGNWVYDNVSSDGELLSDLWTNNFISNRISTAPKTVCLWEKWNMNGMPIGNLVTINKRLLKLSKKP